jgi:hypothetical protein
VTIQHNSQHFEVRHFLVVAHRHLMLDHDQQKFAHPMEYPPDILAARKALLFSDIPNTDFAYGR